MRGVDISLAGGWIEVAFNVRPPGEVVVLAEDETHLHLSCRSGRITRIQ